MPWCQRHLHGNIAKTSFEGVQICDSGVFGVADYEYNHKNLPGCTREAVRASINIIYTEILPELSSNAFISVTRGFLGSLITNITSKMNQDVPEKRYTLASTSSTRKY